MSTTELARVDFTVPGVSLTATGLRLPQRLSPQDFHRIGDTLGRINGASAWAVGDWVNSNPATRVVVVQEVADIVGLTALTVTEYARVARKFPYDKRKPNVSWGAHQAVAALPPEEADRLLDQAQEQKWSVAAMRLKVSQPKELTPGTVTVLPKAAKRSLTLKVDWKDEYADDPDILETLNVELARMVKEWAYVKNVRIEQDTKP